MSQMQQQKRQNQPDHSENNDDFSIPAKRQRIVDEQWEEGVLNDPQIVSPAMNHKDFQIQQLQSEIKQLREQKDQVRDKWGKYEGGKAKILLIIFNKNSSFEDFFSINIYFFFTST